MGHDSKPPPSSPGPKISYPLVAETLLRYRAEAESRHLRNSEVMDRRHVLRRMCRELETGEDELLRRGFDRAYRRMVEGV